MRAKYWFSNSEFLEDMDDFIYHFHMAVGIMEAILTREIGRTVECFIENIHISDNKEDSYVVISVNIKWELISLKTKRKTVYPPKNM